MQLAPHKIRVNAIVPNKIAAVGRDEFDPARPVQTCSRAGEPGEAARDLFLASEDLSFVIGETVRRRRHHGDGPDRAVTDRCA